LHQMAQQRPSRMAIAEPLGRDRDGKRQYRQITFRELDVDSTLVAEALLERGAQPGMRVALLVPQGIDFISLVFAMFKAGLTVILIDPGMGRASMIGCLEEARPEGFIAISPAQAVRTVLRHRFPLARLNVTVGRRWFWGGSTLRQLRSRPFTNHQMASAGGEDPAAIIFTTGSTGPPKGVLYRHGNFTQQAEQIQQRYGIAPGEIDLPGFPLFALFNCAMGVSTVIPDMDPTRPAEADPEKIIEAIDDWNVTQAFGSPALWNVVGLYCERHERQLPTVRRVLSAGAPVPPHVLRRMKQAIHSDGDVFTPYGATEALPVASIAASEVLKDTAEQTALGHGTCVGTPFSGIQWKVIAISDAPLSDVTEATELPPGEIGELIVRGPVVTTGYVTSSHANALHKIPDGGGFWHRMGDVGYLDRTGRFWFCGRASHRVVTAHGTLFTVMCEAVFNQHPAVYRSALVGIGPPGQQTPLLIVEPWPDRRPGSTKAKQQLIAELKQIAQRHAHTRSIQHVEIHRSLPVDIRHNAKIFREKLAIRAAKRYTGRR
ncbi:MAG: fatty acid CoA ligase family protein, partial [Pirellulaceae bacterium]